jgi:hypothetical protein
MNSDNAVNKSLPLVQSIACAGVLLEPSKIIRAADCLAGKELANFANGPIDGGTVLRRMEMGTIANGLPGGSQQSLVVLRKEEQRKYDALMCAASFTQILLQKIRPGKFDDPPATGLRQHGAGYQKDGMARFQDPIPQRFERGATVRIIVVIQPRDYLLLLQ